MVAASKSQTLPELNQRSAALGSWDVSTFRPHIHKYKYTPKNGTGEKDGADFRCIFVSISDPSQYVCAYQSKGMRSDDMNPLIEARDKFKQNLKFKLSKVALEASAKQQYLHTPIKVKIDLAKINGDFVSLAVLVIYV